MKNTLITTLGGKGGVGKTAALTSLADYFTTQGRDYIALDADGENQGKTTAFSHAVKQAEPIKLHKLESMDRLLQAAADNQLVLVDLPANASREFIAWFDSVVSTELLEELNLQIFGVGSITCKPGTFASVAEWASKLQDKFHYAVVLNRAEAALDDSNEEAFAEFFTTSAGVAFQKAFDPAVVEMPHLATGAIQLMATTGGLPTEVGNSAAGLFTDRVRLRKWAQQMHRQWGEVFP